MRSLPCSRPGRPDPSAPFIDTITIGEGLHLVLPPAQPIHYGNHSCDPNLWWLDALTLAARRHIDRGEEVTNDYGTSSGDPAFQMECQCGSRLCRRVVTGNDWRREDLRARYEDHWVPALRARGEGTAP